MRLPARQLTEYPTCGYVDSLLAIYMTKAGLDAMRTEDLQTYCLDLLQAARQWRRLADTVVRPLGLSESSALPLLLIARHGGSLNQTALAEAIGVEGPSLVRTLDHLCAAGLVVRAADGSDRRVKFLHLTPKGRALVDGLTEELDGLRMAVFGKTAPGDISASQRVFASIAAAREGSEEAQIPAPVRRQALR